MPDILRQIQQRQPDIIIGFQINYTRGAMTDRFNGVNILFLLEVADRGEERRTLDKGVSARQC